MPGRREPDVAVGHSLALEVGGVRVALLTEVTGLTVERDVVEFREGGAGGAQVVKKLPGNPKNGEVTVGRGLSADRAFETWMADVETDVARARKDAAIVVLDRQGQTLATFTLTKAWPRKLEYVGLRVGGTEPLTERLVLVHDGLHRS